MELSVRNGGGRPLPLTGVTARAAPSRAAATWALSSGGWDHGAALTSGGGNHREEAAEGTARGRERRSSPPHPLGSPRPPDQNLRASVPLRVIFRGQPPISVPPRGAEQSPGGPMTGALLSKAWSDLPGLAGLFPRRVPGSTVVPYTPA